MNHFMLTINGRPLLNRRGRNDCPSLYRTLLVSVIAFVAAVQLHAADIPVANGQIRLLSPASQRTTPESSITIDIDLGAYSGPLIVMLDGVDVSARVNRNGGRVLYSAPHPLAIGTHQLSVWATDPAGPGRAQWSLEISEPKAAFTGRELYSRIGASASYSRRIDDAAGGKEQTSNANISVDVGARQGKAEVEAQGSFAYADTVADNELKPTTYLLALKYGDNSLAVGDVNFRGTPMTAPSLARRGALALIKLSNTELQLTQLSTNTVTGWDSGLSQHNQIYAAALNYTAVSASSQPVHLVATILSGENSQPTSSNVSSVEAPTRGRAAGLQGSGSLFDTTLNGEFAVSDYDADTRDAEAEKRDKSFSLQVSRAIGGIGTSGNYLYAGSQYASIGNPRATADREQFGLSAATTTGASTVSLSASRSHDNVDRDNARPVVYNDTAGLTYALAPAGWPSLSLSYLHGQVSSTSEPYGTPHADNNIVSLSGVTAYGRPNWMANLSLNRSNIDDVLQGSSSSLSRQLSFIWQPWADLHIAPTYAFTESSNASGSQQTTLTSITVNSRVVETLSFDGQVSAVQNSGSGSTVDNMQQNAAVRASWEMGRRLWKLLPGQQASLYLAFNYNRYEDNINPAQDKSTRSVMVGLTVFAPFEYHYREGGNTQ